MEELPGKNADFCFPLQRVLKMFSVHFFKHHYRVTFGITWTETGRDYLLCLLMNTKLFSYWTRMTNVSCRTVVGKYVDRAGFFVTHIFLRQENWTILVTQDFIASHVCNMFNLTIS